MTDILHGVDLQRAIAEAKGWKPGIHDGVQIGWFCDNKMPDGSVADWHIDPKAAHALLDELVAEGWEVSIRIEAAWFRSLFEATDANGTHHFIDDAPDFCTAVGNLWLECRG